MSTTTFERAKNSAEVSPDQFAAMNQGLRNIWEIENMSTEFIGKAIFPEEAHGTYSDHFTGKLVTACGACITAKGFIKWFFQLNEEWQMIVCKWLNARQF